MNLSQSSSLSKTFNNSILVTSQQTKINLNKNMFLKIQTQVLKR